MGLTDQYIFLDSGCRRGCFKTCKSLAAVFNTCNAVFNTCNAVFNTLNAVFNTCNAVFRIHSNEGTISQMECSAVVVGYCLVADFNSPSKHSTVKMQAHLIVSNGRVPKVSFNGQNIKLIQILLGQLN